MARYPQNMLGKAAPQSTITTWLQPLKQRHILLDWGEVELRYCQVKRPAKTSSCTVFCDERADRRGFVDPSLGGMYCVGPSVACILQFTHSFKACSAKNVVVNRHGNTPSRSRMWRLSVCGEAEVKDRGAPVHGGAWSERLAHHPALHLLFKTPEITPVATKNYCSPTFAYLHVAGRGVFAPVRPHPVCSWLYRPICQEAYAGVLARTDSCTSESIWTIVNLNTLSDALALSLYSSLLIVECCSVCMFPVSSHSTYSLHMEWPAIMIYQP